MSVEKEASAIPFHLEGTANQEQLGRLKSLIVEVGLEDTVTLAFEEPSQPSDELITNPSDKEVGCLRNYHSRLIAEQDAGEDITGKILALTTPVNKRDSHHFPETGARRADCSGCWAHVFEVPQGSRWKHYIRGGLMCGQLSPITLGPKIEDNAS